MIDHFRKRGSIISIGTLLALSFTSAALQAAEDKDLKIEVDGGSRLTIRANEVTPERLLDSLSQAIGVSVTWTGTPSQAPLISGEFQGNLTELLPRILRKRRYIAIMGPQGPTRLIVASEGRPGTILNPDAVLVDNASPTAHRMALEFDHKAPDLDGNAIEKSSPLVKHHAPPGSVAEMLEIQGWQAAASGNMVAYSGGTGTSSLGGDGSGMPPRRSRPPSYGKPGAQQSLWSTPTSDGPSAAVSTALTDQAQKSQLSLLAAQAQLKLKTLVAGSQEACKQSGC